MENLNSELKFQPAAGKGGSRANASLPPKEQNQTPENQNSGKPKRRYWRFIIVFFAMIIGVFVLLNIGLWGWQKYRYWQDEKTAQRAEEGIRKWQQEDYERAMADTYGGKTPQETLQMYIGAVEKGDYELASKYFIGSYQERELKSFDGNTKKNIENMINILKTVRPYTKEEEREISKINYKSHLENFPSMNIPYEEYINTFDKLNPNTATMFTKVDGYNFSVNFKKYPNNIWKIIDF